MAPTVGDLLPILGLQVSDTDEAVLKAFLAAVREKHPDNGGKAREFLDVLWAYRAAQDRDVYARDLRAWQQANPRPDEVSDWRAWTIGEVHGWLENSLLGVGERPTQDGRHPSPEEVAYLRQQLVEGWAEYLPPVWDMERVGWWMDPPEVLDVRADLAALLRLPEFDRIRQATFQVVYRTKVKRRLNHRILASIKPLTPSERALSPVQPAPLFRIEIDWVWWAAMASWTSPRGVRELRYRLLHHELGHALVVRKKDGTLIGRMLGHEVEEFGATAERWGAFHTSHAVFVERAYHHPRTQALLAAVPKELRTWLVEREEDDDRRPLPRPPPTPATFAGEVRELRTRLVELRARRGDVDFGYAPWDELEAQLEVLAEIGTPRGEDLERLAHVREVFRRWAPPAVG